MGRVLKSRVFGIIVVACVIAGGVWYFTRPDPNANPVVAGAGDTINVLDFSNLTNTDVWPKGWLHRTFWTKPAMELSLVTHKGKKAMRCETNGGASILARSADIDLTKFSMIEWDWFIETPIKSEIDERTKEGDDHPARLFIRFEDGEGKDHHVEIIWSNKFFKPGDYKYIKKFPHYVANGLDENIGRWHHQKVDLLNIYRTTTKRNDKPRLKTVAIFCDSDNTGGHSVAYFSDVVMGKK